MVTASILHSFIVLTMSYSASLYLHVAGNLQTYTILAQTRESKHRIVLTSSTFGTLATLDLPSLPSQFLCSVVVVHKHDHYDGPRLRLPHNA
ncbi:hypothetical protein L195_g009583 [Trifolium pratense]|uniref:Uncharacterized protein n=1 Tax=Trifolium pratense TaxID=57577 RepID=A0A2K3PCB1_TRIPR|nr:hypothetical protein L195_g009583 [Trifolium pratense]